MINLLIFNKIKFDSLREYITDNNNESVCYNIWSMTNVDDNIIDDGIFWGEDEPQLVNSVYEITRRNIHNHLQFFHLDIVFNIKNSNIKFDNKNKQKILSALK